MEYICTAKTFINVVEKEATIKLDFLLQTKRHSRTTLEQRSYHRNLKLTSNCFCGMCCVLEMVRPG